jgi:predicted dehydrogenase
MPNQQTDTLIRWGFVGCGDVVERKSGPAFKNVMGSAISAVMSRNYHKAQDFASRHGIPKAYDSVEDLVADPTVDAVYIATPPGAHVEPALATAKAGKPAYIEKPLGRTYDEALTIQQAFEENRQPLYGAYYRRALPKVETLQALIKHKAIGNIHSFRTILQKPRPSISSTDELPWRLKPEVSGGGLFMDVAPHAIDLYEYLLGSIVEVQSVVKNFSRISNAEDYVSALFTLDNGITGIGLWDFSGFNQEDQMVISGDKGALYFSIHGKDPIAVVNEEGTNHLAHETPDPIQMPMIAEVVRTLNGNGQLEPNGQSAAKVNWVTDQVLASYRTTSA